LFGAGSFLYGRLPQGLLWLGCFLVSGAGLLRLLPTLRADLAAAAPPLSQPRTPR